jgi:hypothetical protein
MPLPMPWTHQHDHYHCGCSVMMATATTGTAAVVFKGPVWSSFLTPRGVNRGPEPVQTDTQSCKTATKLNRTGPIWFG